MTETSFGRYRLLALLGEGGMGQVYRAHDTATDRTVALKVLPSQAAEDPVFQQRFRREAQIAAGLSDPHVVPIHGYGEIDGRLYVDMRLIDGRNLETLLQESGRPLSAERAVRFVEQVAEALHAAHSAGLVHRDVKPSNVLVTDRDFAYLIDFGIAHAANDTRITKTGHAIGTFAYMAPERFTSGETDPRSDVYALTCVLHQCLTGRQPFSGDSVEQQIAAHLMSPPPRPSTIAAVPSGFDAVIAKGMAKDPDARYQSAIELANAARAALSTAPATIHHAETQAAPTLGAVDAGRGRSRTTVINVALAGCAVALAVAIVLFLVTDDDSAATTATASRTTTRAQTTATTTSQLEPSVPALPAFNLPPDLGADCTYPASPDPAAKAVNPPRSGRVPTEPAAVSMSMLTNQGPVGLALDNAKVPCTVNSFVSLAQQGYFNNTTCHRLTTSASLSVLQCGDPTANGTGGPGYQFADEYPTNQYPANDPALQEPVVYPRGTLAMANAGPNTNGSQFFIVYRDSELPPDYTVFGTVDQTGLATMDKIAAAGTTDGGEDGTPKLTVEITSVSLD